MTRCLSASGLNCLPLRLSAILFRFFSPLRRQFREGVIWGASSFFPLAPPDQTTRIRSSNCNMCQTALNLEPPLSVRVASVTRFWCFYRVQTDRGGRSVFVKKKGAAAQARTRSRGGAAVAIEVITEGWNCRLWNRAPLARAVEAAETGERGEGGSGKSKHRIIHRFVRRPSEVRTNSEEESGAPKKRSPYNLPCGETSISLARSVRHRVISRR